METRLELDVLIYPDEVRVATPEDLRQWDLETASQVSNPTVRLFVALYPYNPAAMSPNPDTAAEELPFVPGQIIKVKTLYVLVILCNVCCASSFSICREVSLKLDTAAVSCLCRPAEHVQRHELFS